MFLELKSGQAISEIDFAQNLIFQEHLFVEFRKDWFTTNGRGNIYALFYGKRDCGIACKHYFKESLPH